MSNSSSNPSLSLVPEGFVHYEPIQYFDNSPQFSSVPPFPPLQYMTIMTPGNPPSQDVGEDSSDSEVEDELEIYSRPPLVADSHHEVYVDEQPLPPEWSNTSGSLERTSGCVHREDAAKEHLLLEELDQSGNAKIMEARSTDHSVVQAYGSALNLGPDEVEHPGLVASLPWDHNMGELYQFLTGPLEASEIFGNCDEDMFEFLNLNPGPALPSPTYPMSCNGGTSTQDQNRDDTRDSQMRLLYSTEMQ